MSQSVVSMFERRKISGVVNGTLVHLLNGDVSKPWCLWIELVSVGSVHDSGII